MKQKMKALLLSGYVLGYLPVDSVLSAPRDANAGNKIVIKLQTLVKDMTAERDQLKTEKDKLASEIDKLKQEKSAAVSAEEKLSSELAAQKNTNAAVSNQLDLTHAKLLEVIEKYNVLNEDQNKLSATHANLQTIQKQTEAELQSCEAKNIKMFEAAKEVLNRYENKGLMDTLLENEPVLQFKSVEMESIIQEYEDKLIKQKYQHKEIVSTNDPTTGTETNP